MSALAAIVVVAVVPVVAVFDVLVIRAVVAAVVVAEIGAQHRVLAVQRGPPMVQCTGSRHWSALDPDMLELVE